MIIAKIIVCVVVYLVLVVLVCAFFKGANIQEKVGKQIENKNKGVRAKS